MGGNPYLRQVSGSSATLIPTPVPGVGLPVGGYPAGFGGGQGSMWTSPQIGQPVVQSPFASKATSGLTAANVAAAAASAAAAVQGSQKVLGLKASGSRTLDAAQTRGASGALTNRSSQALKTARAATPLDRGSREVRGARSAGGRSSSVPAQRPGTNEVRGRAPHREHENNPPAMVWAGARQEADSRVSTKEVNRAFVMNVCSEKQEEDRKAFTSSPTKKSRTLTFTPSMNRLMYQHQVNLEWHASLCHGPHIKPMVVDLGLARSRSGSVGPECRSMSVLGGTGGTPRNGGGAAQVRSASADTRRLPVPQTPPKPLQPLPSPKSSRALAKELFGDLSRTKPEPPPQPQASPRQLDTVKLTQLVGGHGIRAYALTAKDATPQSPRYSPAGRHIGVGFDAHGKRSHFITTTGAANQMTKSLTERTPRGRRVARENVAQVTDLNGKSRVFVVAHHGSKAHEAPLNLFGGH